MAKQSKEYFREYYQKNKNKILDSSKKNYEKDKESIRDRHKRYSKNRRDKIKALPEQERLLIEEKIRRQTRVRYDKMKNSKCGKEIFYNNAIKRRYGISLEDYNILLKNQDYKCGICKCTENTLKQSNRKLRFYIDHDHKTGKVRGLLCHNCNHGLGNFADNVESLQNAINYLKL